MVSLHFSLVPAPSSKSCTYCSRATSFGHYQLPKQSFIALLFLLGHKTMFWGSLVYIYCCNSKVKANRCWLFQCSGTVKKASVRLITVKHLWVVYMLPRIEWVFGATGVPSWIILISTLESSDKHCALVFLQWQNI